MRKQDLYEKAYYFCKDLFELDSGVDMDEQQLLELTSSILSIVLSHHFQKEDIKRIVKGTQVDF